MKRARFSATIIFGLFLAINASVAQVIDLNRGLAAYYPFNANAADRSGNGNHGGVHGAALTEDRHGTALSAYAFNGEDSYIEVPANAGLDITNNLTLSLWAKRSSEVEGGLISYGPEVQDGFETYAISTGGSVQYGFHYNWPVSWEYLSVQISAIAEWRHLVATFRDGNISIFVDGALAAQTTRTVEVLPLGRNRVLRLGVNHPGGDDYFDGIIDDVRIYNRVLANEEIRALAHESREGPARIDVQPAGVIGYPGGGAAMSVFALGAEPLNFQWFKDGVAVEAGTNAVLFFDSLVLPDSGNYSVRVSNDFGAVTSNSVRLEVSPVRATLGLRPSLTIDGEVGKTYLIESATDLSEPVVWSAVTTITLTSPSQLWIDSTVDATSEPKRYYRVSPTK